MIIISPDLVAQVRHAWIADQQHPQRARRKSPIPDSERLGALLDIAFRASMISDAGRLVECRLFVDGYWPSFLRRHVQLPEGREPAPPPVVAPPFQISVDS